MSYEELGLDTLGNERTPPLFFLISDNTDHFVLALAFWQMFNLLCERGHSKNGSRLTVYRFRDNLQPIHPNSSPYFVKRTCHNPKYVIYYQQKSQR